jgi:hypothetical protein
MDRLVNLHRVCRGAWILAIVRGTLPHLGQRSPNGAPQSPQNFFAVARCFEFNPDIFASSLALPRSRRRDKWTESLPLEVIGHATFSSL